MSSLTSMPPGFDRFEFIAEALDASGGFAPSVVYEADADGMVKPKKVVGRCHLVPYPRESMAKFAARSAVSTYENHLRAACERFTGYLVKKPANRGNVEGPAHRKFIEDADWRGNSLDIFLAGFMLEAKARGTMLLLVDMPASLPETAAQQIDARAIPYLTAIKPERVRSYLLDDRGRFVYIAITATEVVDGEIKEVLRRWTDTTWEVLDGERVIRSGSHGFGQCPVIAFTEGGAFPCFGNYEQIAALSKRLYNAQSELDEILRSQTFSLLTYQVPTEAAATFNAGTVAAVIGTHNMLTHSGDTPQFIAPPDGPASVYMQRIGAIEASIRRVGLAIDDTSRAAAESGLALQLRFQSLNSALSSFAQRMQDLERQMWDLFSRGMRIDNRVDVTWPADYSLADIAGQLDVLTLMQSTGFSDAVLIEKRKQVVRAEFSNLEQSLLDELLVSIDEPTQEVPTRNVNQDQGQAPPPGSDGATDPANSQE